MQKNRGSQMHHAPKFVLEGHNNTSMTQLKYVRNVMQPIRTP